MLPNQQLQQLFNQAVQAERLNPNRRIQKGLTLTEHNTQLKKFDSTCRFGLMYRHKWAECRKRQRDEAAGHSNTKAKKAPELQNQNQQEFRPKFNANIVCQICGYVGHSAKHCRYWIPSTSAFGSEPYNKQTTTGNRDFRRDFRRAQHGYNQANEMTTQSYPEEDSMVANNYYQPKRNDNPSN